jgi:hypothetical protein
LYADILLWLRLGWIDYVAPQLYWEIGHPLCDYYTLLDWWSKYSYGRQVFIGHGIYRVNEPSSVNWKRRNEIPNQLKALRQNENVQGSIFFSSKTFANNPNGWNDSLRNNYYRYPALVPPMLWIDNVPPLKPLIEKKSGKNFRIMYRGAEPIKSFAIYTLARGEAVNMQNATLVKVIVEDKVLELNTTTIDARDNDRLFVAVVDRNNLVSEWVELK